MAVIIEGISVVVRRARIEESYPGGWDQFVADCPNQTLCADHDLARVGFMTPIDVEAFVRHLEQSGLIFTRAGKAADIVVVDQLRGPTGPCDWVDFGHVEIDGNRVAACRQVGSTAKRLAMPDGWSYRESLSSAYGFVPTEVADRSLRFLRHENGLDVYLNMVTGAEVFVGRASQKGP